MMLMSVVNCNYNMMMMMLTITSAGDLTRPDVLRSFNVASSRACVITMEDMKTTSLLLIALRKYCPHVPVIVRAKNAQHQKRLINMFG